MYEVSSVVLRGKGQGGSVMGMEGEEEEEEEEKRRRRRVVTPVMRKQSKQASKPGSE